MGPHGHLVDGWKGWLAAVSHVSQDCAKGESYHVLVEPSVRLGRQAPSCSTKAIAVTGVGVLEKINLAGTGYVRAIAERRRLCRSFTAQIFSKLPFLHSPATSR
uniref:Uncharacterized protein n=1 Tax=Schistocephalus solidus TaxID=70667 RepID=A0A0X3Q488_SCHSO